MAGSAPAALISRTEATAAFLDARPVFPGHTLVVPVAHVETMLDAPDELLAAVMVEARRVAAALESALDAHGSFVAVNNRVSQSVAHLHVHVVPRRRKDGLKGFFWPRHRYDSPKEMAGVADALRAALAAG